MNSSNHSFARFYSFLVIGIFTLILAMPASRQIFGELSGRHPFIMGFIKFALLAMAGELIALRLAAGKWGFPEAFLIRTLIWGALGIVMTLAMKLFGAGIQQLLEVGMLPGGSGRIWKAFMTSFWCNLMFAPIMMCTHKMTDTYLELREKGIGRIGFAQVIDTINWHMFFGFTIAKTIPFFWIPAHTITFSLPGEFQTIMAAYLSIALGIILNLKRQSVSENRKIFVKRPKYSAEEDDYGI